MTATMSKFTGVKPSKFACAEKRGGYYDISEVLASSPYKLTPEEVAFYESVDVTYRALCAILYNYAPSSGHPGGSISSGKIVQALLLNSMNYDFSDPDRDDSDMIAYAAGHKAMGLYSFWALRNELVRIGDSSMLPSKLEKQLRLEDLLGFRRNPTCDTPLFRKFHSKALDGHPTPATPFVKIATGASGVGLSAAVGLALGAMDVYQDNAPGVNIIEGEGGMTPGRVQEALACAATGQLYNTVLHVDWNQASIDSDHVCPEGGKPGDYVQWTPAELLHLHDWNVIYVPNGHDFVQVLAAQELVRSLPSKQPTAIVYKTVKGWKYGIQGRGSHGAGHKFASDAFYGALDEFEKRFKIQMPRFCGEPTPEGVEACYWDTLSVIRKALESDKNTAKMAAKKIAESKSRLDAMKRTPKKDAPAVDRIYSFSPEKTPAELVLKTGSQVTLRGALGSVLGYLNKESGGAILASSADLSGSTSLNEIVKPFAAGFYNAVSNNKSKLISIGGICEDAMGGVMTGLAGYGHHIGATSSYAAFIAALEHIPARLHAIGQQARQHVCGKPYNPFIMINAHAGVKTGEDGPTHADPQALQLLQENFPTGTLITLTPWDPQEIWALAVSALNRRPAVLAPFVTRPPETIYDRKAIGIPGPEAAAKGAYEFMKADPSRPCDGTVVIQGNGVAMIFLTEVMPKLREKKYNLNVIYVASTELFQLQDEAYKRNVYTAAMGNEAMGITDFTLPTMYFWVRSQEGLKRTLHPFKDGRFLGSGKAESVLAEAGVDAAGQLKAVEEYIKARKENKGCWC